MKKNTLKYVKYPSFHELIGVPLFTVKAIKRLIKKEKIEDSLNIIIEKSKQKANEMSEKEHSESDVALLEDDFKAFDDLFSKNFKSKQATKMCFEERIKYCFEKYKEESRKLSSATNSLVLEENFLKGAQRILPLYFFLKEDMSNTTPKKRTASQKSGLDKNVKLESLFRNENDYDQFAKVLMDFSYLEDDVLNMPKGFLAGILILLQNKGIIKEASKPIIIKALQNSYDYSISEATFTNSSPYSTKESQKALFSKIKIMYDIDIE